MIRQEEVTSLAKAYISLAIILTIIDFIMVVGVTILFKKTMVYSEPKTY